MGTDDPNTAENEAGRFEVNATVRRQLRLRRHLPPGHRDLAGNPCHTGVARLQQRLRSGARGTGRHASRSGCSAAATPISLRCRHERRRGRSLRVRRLPGRGRDARGHHRASHRRRAASLLSGRLAASQSDIGHDQRRRQQRDPSSSGSRSTGAADHQRDRRRATTRARSLAHRRSAARRLTGAASPTGPTPLRLVARGCSRERAASSSAPLQIDGTPPSAMLKRARGKQIVLIVSDPASGVAATAVEVRRNSTEPYRTLNVDASPTASCARRRPRQRVEDRHARHGKRQRGQRHPGQPDPAHGDQREGRPSLPPGPLRPREDPVRPPRDAARPPHALRRPVVRRPDDRRHLGGPQERRQWRRQPAPPSPIAAAASRSRSPPARAAPTASCSPAPAARSAPPAACPCACRPRARSTRHARAFGAGRVRFSGRLRNRGQRIPGRGLVLILQGRDSGKWRTFEDTRTNRKGRWRVSYGFSGRAGRPTRSASASASSRASRSSSATRAALTIRVG